MKEPLSNIVSVYPRPKDVSPISYLLCDFLYDFIYLKETEIASKRERDREREKESTQERGEGRRGRNKRAGSPRRGQFQDPEVIT